MTCKTQNSRLACLILRHQKANRRAPSAPRPMLPRLDALDVGLVTALLANTLLVACEAIDNGEAALQPTVDVGLCFQLCQRLAEIAMGLEHLNNGLDGMNL